MFRLFTPLQSRFQAILKQSPFILFFGVMLILLGSILLANSTRKPIALEQASLQKPKQVESFIVGTDTTYTSASALIKKDSVQPIVALIAGTVQTIHVKPGDRVTAATSLMRLSADYGTNAAGIATTVTERRQRFAEDMARLDKQILDLEKKNVRNDTELDTTQKASALKKLKRERAMLRETLESGSLQVDLSRAGEAVFQPKSLVLGTIEHIAVQPGDFVTPGTLLAVIHADRGTVALEVTLDSTLAQSFDMTLPSRFLTRDGTEKMFTPSFFSAHETPEGLFTIRYLVSPAQADAYISNERVLAFLPLRAPIGKTFVPLNALFTHTDHVSLFTENTGVAEERTVDVSSIFGQAALLNEEIPKDTSVLLNRALIAGEPVIIAR